MVSVNREHGYADVQIWILVIYSRKSVRRRKGVKADVIELRVE